MKSLSSKKIPEKGEKIELTVIVVEFKGKNYNKLQYDTWPSMEKEFERGDNWKIIEKCAVMSKFRWNFEFCIDFEIENRILNPFQAFATF